MKNIFALLIALLSDGIAFAADSPTRLKTENFDTDPGWDNSVNRVEATDPPSTHQDFGWSDGRIGGIVWRSTTPAWYGLPLEHPLSFKEPFTVSGKISVDGKTSERKSVAYLGFFNHERQGWRPWSSLAIRLVNDGGSTRFYTDVMNGNWSVAAAETECTVPSDTSEHTWSLSYDPDATREEWSDMRLRAVLSRKRQTIEEILARMQKSEPDLTRTSLEERLQAALKKGLISFLPRGGGPYWLLKKDKGELLGAITVSVDGGKVYRLFLDATVRNGPVSLDRFGMFNMQMGHSKIKFYISHLILNGQKIDLSHDPNWESHDSHRIFAEQDFQRQNFGYSPDSSLAGGGKGEMGGQTYNVEPIDPLHGFYADEVGRLTLDDPLHFSGKMNFMEGSTDAGLFFGYFRAEDEKRALPPNSKTTGASGWPQANTLGLVVDGPARVGWWLLPVCAAGDRHQFVQTEDHLFLPTRKPRTFSFDYDPVANHGVGRVTVTLDGEKPYTLDLTRDQRKMNATFDHFGLMSFRRGGKYSIIYFDDLTYTTRAPADVPPVRHEQKITKVPYPPGGRKY